jgi:hypothetical protein
LFKHGRDHLLKRLCARAVSGGLGEVTRTDPRFLALLETRHRVQSASEQLGTLTVALNVVLLVVRLVARFASARSAVRAAAAATATVLDRVGHAKLRPRLCEARASVHSQQVVDNQRAGALLARRD